MYNDFALNKSLVKSQVEKRPQKVFKFTSQLIEVLIIRFLHGMNSFEIEFLEHVIQAQCFFSYDDLILDVF